MKKGFLLWLLQLAVLIGLYYLVLRGRVSSPADWLGALGGGIALTLVTGAFYIAWSARKGRALLGPADTGAPFEDGQRIAAVGPTLALSSPVHVPLSGDPCVLGLWSISHQSDEVEGKSQKSPSVTTDDFSGGVMAPFVVQAPAGNVRILGFPVFEGFPATTLHGAEDFTRARDYLQSASFEKSNLVKIFFDDLAADETGYIRKDWQMAGDDFRLDPNVHNLTEQIVREGDTVTAFGIYSVERGGLVPSPGRQGAGLKLIQGDSAEVRKTLTEKLWKYSVGGVLLLLISHVSLFDYAGRHRLKEDPAEVMQSRKNALFQAVEDGDLAAVTAALDAGLDPDVRDETTGNTPLMVAEDPRIARRLILAGADVNVRNMSDWTPLIIAAKSCNLEVVRLLLQSGADVQARDSASNRTPLEWAEGHCNLPGDERFEEVVKVLRAAGAREETP